MGLNFDSDHINKIISIGVKFLKLTRVFVDIFLVMIARIFEENRLYYFAPYCILAGTTFAVLAHVAGY